MYINIHAKCHSVLVSKQLVYLYKIQTHRKKTNWDTTHVVLQYLFLWSAKYPVPFGTEEIGHPIFDSEVFLKRPSDWLHISNFVKHEVRFDLITFCITRQCKNYLSLSVDIEFHWITNDYAMRISSRFFVILAILTVTKI